LDRDVLMVGVGGQGALLASKIMGAAAIASGLDVKVSEVHGMARRGGGVVTYVRMSGGKVRSPIVERGGADCVIAFEKLEALRWAGHLKDGGLMVMGTQEIYPMPVVTGAERYPDDIVGMLSGGRFRLVAVDALAIAESCGDMRAVNTVLLGVYAKASGIAEDIWLEAVKSNAPARSASVNLDAFGRGWRMAGE